MRYGGNNLKTLSDDIVLNNNLNIDIQEKLKEGNKKVVSFIGSRKNRNYFYGK